MGANEYTVQLTRHGESCDVSRKGRGQFVKAAEVAHEAATHVTSGHPSPPATRHVSPVSCRNERHDQDDVSLDALWATLNCQRPKLVPLRSFPETKHEGHIRLRHVLTLAAAHDILAFIRFKIRAITANKVMSIIFSALGAGEPAMRAEGSRATEQRNERTSKRALQLAD
ncbi:unnamed protein product, partial [Iphiclides podalirius]